MSEDRNNIMYDVALSFAGEDRKYAEMLATKLRSSGLVVFYDAFEESKLWGENLYTYLADIYGKRAKYCVMLLSEHYAKKLWTSHERQFAQARAFSENRPYILPIKIDDTEIPGIPSTIGYIDLRKVDVDYIVILLLEKLGASAPMVQPEKAASQRHLDCVRLELDLNFKLLHDLSELKVITGEILYNVKNNIIPPFILNFSQLDELQSELSSLNKNPVTIEERRRKLALKEYMQYLQIKEEEITKCITLMIHTPSLKKQLCIVNADDLALAIKGLSEIWYPSNDDGWTTKLDLCRKQAPILFAGIFLSEEETKKVMDYAGVSNKWELMGGWPLLDLPLELVTYKAAPRIILETVRHKPKLTDSEIEKAIDLTGWSFGLG